MLGLRYKVGNKQFVNPFQGLYESARTGQFSEAVLPKYHLDKFLEVDVESLKQYTSADLIRKKLQILRDSQYPDYSVIPPPMPDNFWGLKPPV